MIPGAREKLYQNGVAWSQRFCEKNGLEFPEIRPRKKDVWLFGSTCAYYRPTFISICVEKCATPGYGGRAWSWPGYVVDRTPYGVIAHELGHHVDITLSGFTNGYLGSYSRDLRKKIWKEEPITTYCPNDGEWFAEIFRLFVTNPDLLRLIRPRAYDRLAHEFKLSTKKSWEEVLANAPERTIRAAKNKIAHARSGA